MNFDVTETMQHQEALDTVRIASPALLPGATADESCVSKLAAWVTDAGLEYLTGLKNLELLTLPGTAVTDKGVAKLKAALPKCNITR